MFNPAVRGNDHRKLFVISAPPRSPLCLPPLPPWSDAQDFPDELLPALVERLHGKADKREDIVNAFVAVHPLCTKKMVRFFPPVSSTPYDMIQSFLVVVLIVSGSFMRVWCSPIYVLL